MSRFGMLVAVLQLCAAFEAAFRRDWQRTIIYVGFSIGSAAVAWR